MLFDHFEIRTLELIKKLSPKVMHQLNWNFDAFYFQNLTHGCARVTHCVTTR